MSNNTFEQQNPESVSEVYTTDTINSMIDNFEEIFGTKFSDEVFDDLSGKDQEYIKFAFEIKDSIKIYEKHSGEVFSYNKGEIINSIDEDDFIKQMEDFKASVDSISNVVNIDGTQFINNVNSDGIYNEETKKTRSGFKQFVKKILSSI